MIANGCFIEAQAVAGSVRPDCLSGGGGAALSRERLTWSVLVCMPTRTVRRLDVGAIGKKLRGLDREAFVGDWRVRSYSRSYGELPVR